MASHITPIQFKNLKRIAKKCSRADNSLQHSVALDKLALENGYQNWSQLAKAVNAGCVPLPASLISRPHQVRVSGWVVPGPDRVSTQFWHSSLPTRHPAAHYAKFKRIPDNWDVRRRTVESVVTGIDQIQKNLAFMDSTELRTSSAYSSLFYAQDARLDHFCVWRDAENRYVVSNEPYRPSDKREGTKAWCRANGWTFREMPQGIGMHNTCSTNCPADCTEHTVLILMSPPKRGGDLAVVGDALISDFHKLSSTIIEAPAVAEG